MNLVTTEHIIKTNLKHIKSELAYVLDKDIEKLLTIEYEHLNSILRCIKRTKEKLDKVNNLVDKNK